MKKMIKTLRKKKKKSCLNRKFHGIPETSCAFNIKTKDQDNKNGDDYRPPIDLFCVIDHSGSMGGNKSI